MVRTAFQRWRRHWLPSLPLATMVFCFWLLLNDTVTVGHAVMGLVLALLIPPFAARLDREFARIGSLRKVPKMALILLLDIVYSNVTVALQVLGPERRITPGTVSSLLSDDRRFLLVHVLDMDSAEHVVRAIKTRYEAPLMEIFP